MRGIYRGMWHWLVILLAVQPVLAQPIVKFVKDSTYIGAPVEVSLRYVHKSGDELLFPDSTYNFFPFEYRSKRYFPSVTKDGYTTDSVLYSLATYEIDTLQFLSLPVFIFKQNDTLRVGSNTDSIYVHNMIQTIPDSLVLEENTAIIPLGSDFNYPYLLIGAGILAAIAAAIVVFFRKSLYRKYREYVLKRQYSNFLHDFDQQLEAFRLSGTVLQLENILVTWKKYMERVSQKPFTTYTTSEMAKSIGSNGAKISLQSLDKAIYGGKLSGNEISVAEELRLIAKQQYVETIKALGNAGKK